MEVSLRQSTPSYELQHAVLLYGANPRSIDLVTLHPVAKGKNGPVIKQGVSANKASVLEMFQGLTEHVRKPLHVLNPKIIAISDRSMVWWEPAAPRRIAFNCKEIGKRAGVVPQPALLFVLSIEHGWSVFALSENVRPTESTMVAVAPYLNIWETGKICVGSTPTPKGVKREDPDAWTAAFFTSAFTHTNRDNVIKYKGGIFAFWRDMLEGKFKAFPFKVLVQSKTTVRAILNQCEKGDVDA